MKLLHATTIAAVLSVAWSAPLAAESPAVRIFANHSERIAYIETIGTLYNGTVERNSGSGIMIGGSLIVTNNHVIPDADNFRTLQMFVRLGSRTLQTPALQIAAIQRDPDRDLAVLKLAQPVAMPNNSACPVPLLDKESIVPIGSSLFVLGYPVDQDLSVTDGIVSNKSGPSGRWQTTTPVNPGNSGGPAFGESGILVGFAVSGIVKWKHGDDEIVVQNVNFVIPTYNLLQGPLAPLLDELPPPPQRCWRLASAPAPLDLSALSNSVIKTSSFICSTTSEGTPTCSTIPFPINAVRLPSRFSHSFTVARAKELQLGGPPKDFSSYDEAFAAEPGYTITDCRPQISSTNNADQIACKVSSDKRSANLNFRLGSGWGFERTTGWLHATVTLVQKRND
ncbi:hypothetical protein V1283_002650 [Bradyrhizobium sp. AZCC 2262]|uniref:S1C family serine protease n=1 Tax=Bradyrhizobium sp. AZCC 2262 TaxID=3117022 RepID=UPI002FF2142B